MNQRNDSSDLWLIKLETDQVKGPYSTEVICKMILEGIYSGQEFIASYPQGDWKPLSKQPEFYETLLESLENPVERDEKKSQKMDAETVIRSAPVAKHLHTKDDEESHDANKEELSVELQKLLKNDKSTDGSTFPTEAAKPLVYENTLEAKQKAQFGLEKEKILALRQEQLKKLFPVFILLLVLVIGSAAYYFMDDSKPNTSWSLITPNFKSPDVEASEIKPLKVKAIAAIQSGVLDNLISAQNSLVEAVQGQKNDIEALGLLCVVYHSMWPYTKQVSSDLKAISAVTQQVRLANPLSSYSDTCQAMYLLMKGQTNDGRAVIERVLDQNTEEKFILYPILYLIKGQMLEEAGSLVNAEAYYTEAAKKFPAWATAEYSIARAQYKQNKLADALTGFEKILSRQKEYKPALYGAGLALSKQKNTDQALLKFENGFDIKQTVPKELLLESLQEYATLLINRKESGKALSVVKSALKVSPSHRALKDMFISLGGESLAIEDNQVTELIIEGDQFFRLGDFLAAQGRYRAAFDNDKKNTLLALKIAKSMKALNQFRDSIAWIDQAIKIDPKLYSAYSLKADYLLQRYNFTDAEAALTTAQKLDPNNYEILKALSRLEWKKNNLSKALLLGTKAYKQYNVDVELLTLLANINIDIYFRPKKVGTEEVDPEKVNALESAQRYSARAIDLEPAWPESQITYAKYLNAKEGNQKSEKYYQELIKSYPYTLEYRIALAEFFEHQEKNNSAQELYQNVLASDPKNTKANLGLARTYRMKNEYATAIRYYMIGAALDPSDVEPMFSVAQLQLEMAQNESNTEKSSKLMSEALSRFELVKKNNPNYPKIYYFTAKAKMAMSLYAEAVQDLNIEKSKNPNLADPYILSAEMSQKQGEYAPCAKDYLIVIKLRPAADYYFKAAACQRLAGALDLAEDLINDGHALEPGNYNYFREIGYLYDLKGDKAQARKAFQDYLVLTAHNSVDAKEIESKLLSLGN